MPDAGSRPAPPPVPPQYPPKWEESQSDKAPSFLRGHHGHLRRQRAGWVCASQGHPRQQDSSGQADFRPKSSGQCNAQRRAAGR